MCSQQCRGGASHCGAEVINRLEQLGVVLHAYDPSIVEVEAGGILNLRLAGLAQWVSDQPGLCETLPCQTNWGCGCGSVGRVPSWYAQGPGTA